MLLGNNFGKENSYIIIHDLIVFRQITPNINDRINVKLREYQSIINSSIKVTSILDIPVWLKKKSASNTCITLESRSDEEKRENLKIILIYWFFLIKISYLKRITLNNMKHWCDAQVRQSRKWKGGSHSIMLDILQVNGMV